MSPLSDNLTQLLGKELYGVKIEDTPQLRQLAHQARECRTLAFSEKLERVKELTKGAMRNAFDLQKEDNQLYRTVVYSPQSLGYALEKKAGCCRYQATLFFILGMEAELGDKQLIRSAYIQTRETSDRTVATCFNTVIHDGQQYDISIFCESLNNKTFDYTEGRKPVIPDSLKPHLTFFKGYPIDRGFDALPDKITVAANRALPGKDLYEQLIGGHSGQEFYSYSRENDRVKLIVTTNKENI